jgi:hypothetical protein
MYVLFCVLTPLLMRCAARWGWSRVIAASAVVWVGAQFGLRRVLYDFFTRILGWDMPMNAMGAFDILAWQFLWVLGLWFGALGFGKTQAVVLSGRKVLNIALAVSCAIFAWRRYSGPMGFSDLAMHLFWIDKWTLSPVRVVNLAALLCVLTGFGTQLAKYCRVPALASLGRASLWVFGAHVAIVLAVLGLVDDPDYRFGGWAGLAIVVLAYGLLWLVAAIHASLRRRRMQPVPT